MFCHRYGDNQILFPGSRKHHRYILCEGMAVLQSIQKNFGIGNISFFQPACYIVMYPGGLFRILLGGIKGAQFLFCLLKIFLGRNGCEAEKKQEQNQQLFHYIKNILCGIYSQEEYYYDIRRYAGKGFL